MPARRKATSSVAIEPSIEIIKTEQTKIISLEQNVMNDVAPLDGITTVKTIHLGTTETNTKKRKPSSRTTNKNECQTASSLDGHVSATVSATASDREVNINTSQTGTGTEIVTVADDKPKKKVVSRSKAKVAKAKDDAFALRNQPNDGESENIIIHLPIHSDNSVESANTPRSGLRYDPHISIPTGYEHTTDAYQYIKTSSSLSNPSHNFLNSELVGVNYPPTSDMCQYPFDSNNKTTPYAPEQTAVDVYSANGRHASSHNLPVNTHTPYSVEDIKTDTITQLKSSRENDIHSILRNSKTNVEKCLSQMDECNKTSSWPKATTVHCWWCCHPFDNPPCAIPSEYKNGTYNVYGIFCSPECAGAYNFDDTRTSTDVWERYTLLNMLYRNVYSDKHYKIKLAPPRQTLKIFGGTLTIKEFRANFQSTTHSYKMVMPPMISIIPVQELSSIDKGFTSKQDIREMPSVANDVFDDMASIASGSGIGINGSSNANGGLRLKRSKPFVACKNTLNKCMQITVHRDGSEQEGGTDTDREDNDSNDMNTFEEGDM
jgi:hypothetical protein